MPGSPDESAALRAEGDGMVVAHNQGDPGTNGKFARVQEDAKHHEIALDVSTQLVMGG